MYPPGLSACLEVRPTRLGSAHVSVLLVAPREAPSDGHRHDHGVSLCARVAPSVARLRFAAAHVPTGGAHAQAEAAAAFLAGRGGRSGQIRGQVLAGRAGIAGEE